MSFVEPKKIVYTYFANTEEVGEMYRQFKECGYSMPPLTTCLHEYSKIFLINPYKKTISIADSTVSNIPFVKLDYIYKEEHEMTVKEFFKLLDIYDYDESKDARDVFGENYHYRFEELRDVYTDEEIISKFHEYKTIKDKKKILETKWAVTCRIIQTKNKLKKCVYEEDMPKNQTNANNFLRRSA